MAWASPGVQALAHAELSGEVSEPESLSRRRVYLAGARPLRTPVPCPFGGGPVGGSRDPPTLPYAHPRSDDFLALWDEGGVAFDSGSEIVFGHAVFERLIRVEMVRGLGLVVAGGHRSLDARLAEAVSSAPFGCRTFRAVVAP